MRNLSIKAASWLQTRRFHDEEEGQTAVEYALVIGLVALVAVAALATAATGWIGKVTTAVNAKFP
jgi:Flp pilus assembly pilin Flp